MTQVVALRTRTRDCAWCFRDQHQARLRGRPSDLRRKASAVVRQPGEPDLVLCRQHLQEWEIDQRHRSRPARPVRAGRRGW